MVPTDVRSRGDNGDGDAIGRTEVSAEIKHL